MPKLRVDTNWNIEREHAPLLQRDETELLNALKCSESLHSVRYR